MKYTEALSAADPGEYELLLYYGSFFTFLRSALQALKTSDAIFSDTLRGVQQQYFETRIKNDPVFKLLKGERDKLGHGEDGLVAHPFIPESLVARHIDAGGNLYDAVFRKAWPDGEFKGDPVVDVMCQSELRVLQWLDEIDALDARAHDQG